MLQFIPLDKQVPIFEQIKTEQSPVFLTLPLFNCIHYQ